MKPFIRPTTLDDVQYLADNLSEADRQEIHYLSGETPFKAIHDGFIAGNCYVVDLEGRAVVMFGVNGEKDGPGAVWMLCTDEISKVTRLIRTARLIVQDMLQEHSFIGNIAWSKNTVHLKWIKWLGFTFSGETITRNGEVFLWFGQSYSEKQVNTRLTGDVNV